MPPSAAPSGASGELLREAPIRRDRSPYAIHKALQLTSPPPNELHIPPSGGLDNTRVLVFWPVDRGENGSIIWNVTRIRGTGGDDDRAEVETSLIILRYSPEAELYCNVVLKACPPKSLWTIPLVDTSLPPPPPPPPPLKKSPRPISAPPAAGAPAAIFVTEFNMDPNWRGTLEDAKALACESFKEHGLGCSVIRSRSSKCGDEGETSTIINFTMGCSRAGKFKSKAVEGIRATSTKSTDCKAQMTFKVCEDGLFRVASTIDQHNHEKCLGLCGITQYTRPSVEEGLAIRREAAMGRGPVRILGSLMVQNPSTMVTVAQIKESKRGIMRRSLGARTPIEAFVDQLRGVGPGNNAEDGSDDDDEGVKGNKKKYGETPVGDADDDDDNDGSGSGSTFYSRFVLKGDYYYALYIDQATGEIKRVAIFHKSSVELARNYPWILLMDSTFNVVNIPGLRCLNFAGRTACGKYFIIGVGLMKGDEVSTRDFKWQLTALKDLVYVDQFPVVIIGDRELAMVNAILAVFACAVFILCLWHVDKAVEGAASKAFPDDDEELEGFMARWVELRESKTEDLYEQRLQSLQVTYPSMIAYLKTEWLNHHKESIVDCYVNEYLHFGLRWSSPVEKQNHLLKFYGNHTPGNLFKFLADFTRLSVVQYQRVQNELAKQSQRTPTGALNHLELFANLQNQVSEKALLHMCSQLELFMGSVDEGGDALPPCTGYTNRCMGLPCVHDIQRCFERSIPLSIDDVHESWYLDPTSVHRDKKSNMEPQLREPAGMAPRAQSATGRRSDAVTVGLGRRESSHETISRVRKVANQLVVKQLQADQKRAEVEEKRTKAEQLRQKKEATKLAADQEKQKVKEAATTAKKLDTAAKRKAREEENTLLSKNKKNKCEHCSKVEVVGWVYCDDGSACSVDVSDDSDRWHKLCCAGLKKLPTAETWFCALCLLGDD